jgi:ureidoacrylate peracid hydrolase
MNNRVIPAELAPTHASAPALLQAEPQALEIDWQRTAVVVIDMQHAFVSKGAMFDLRGLDISGSQKIVEPIKRINSAVREKGSKVLYTVTQYSSDLRETGSPNSPYWYKGVLTAYREHPEWQDKLLTRGTWGADIVEPLKPQEGDIVVEKQRYSGFFGTDLDMILRTYDIKYLVFMGVATNICVEATIRDAYYLDYFPILLSDAAANVGPASTQETTIFNVKMCYGWVTTTNNILKALRQLE